MPEDKADRNLPAPSAYAARWTVWIDDPAIGEQGLTFDRTQADAIVAPKGRFRVCAWHLDFDERPTYFLDVASLAEGRHVVDNFAAATAGRNVDFGTVHDDKGDCVIDGGYG